MTKKTIVLIGFILLKFVLQYALTSPLYDLHRDEYLHLDQGDHLAWGYISVPPVSSWIAFVIKLLGGGVFWVRFFPALFGALTIVVVWKTIEFLKGNLFSLILGAVAVLFSALLRLNLLFQPNSLDILCWTAFYYVVIRYLDSSNRKWLYWGAVIFALAFLNKYNFVFLLLGLFPAILLSAHRKLLLDKDFYLAIVLGLVLISPNLLWQYHNGFPVFHHLEELQRTQLDNVSRVDFLKGQLLFFLGALLVIIAALVSLFIYKPFRKYRLFFWSMLFTLGIFVFFRAKDYYAVGIYPIYMAFGSVYLSEFLSHGHKRCLRPVMIAIPILIFVPLIDIAFPFKEPQYIIKNPQRYQPLGLLRWEDGKDHQLPQDFADMLGWRELAQKVDAACAKFPDDDHTFILCDNYGQAGAINFYSKNKNVRAVSFNADYINWFVLDNKIEHFIRVKEHEGAAGELAESRPFFEVGYLADSIANPMAREYRTSIFVFDRPKMDINQRLKAEVDAANYNR